MEEHVNDISKMALALTSAQMAKDLAISEFGLGEDVSMHFMSWDESHLRVICQMGETLSKKTPEERFIQSRNLCLILRKYWWSTAVTMVSEGYCSLDSEKTKGMDLSAAFADAGLPVYECITVSHVGSDGDGNVLPVSMVAAPYRVGLGRKVIWNEVLVYPEVAENYIKQTKYPTMLKNVMFEDVEEVVNPAVLTDMRQEIASLGFLMQEF